MERDECMEQIHSAPVLIYYSSQRWGYAIAKSRTDEVNLRIALTEKNLFCASDSKHI